ncbi:O-antigen ligase family protein [Sessilibacter corallicola]|uniref:O-antigen ligase-related domain-containing protein n=1 Tax=Sessilibacter corallicola TaxID=2904075 RepID=A0ABQ0AAP5_9GAMM|nr:O-antigen ligase family protein [Sessilibacter corallicola]MCE2028164.1 O-antigen ligase family protein [Sessilibacter corallicola]
MIYYLKIFIVLGTTIIVGSYLFNKAFQEPRAYLWGKASLILVGVTALMGNIWLIYFATGYICFKMIEEEREEKICAFLALFSAIPMMKFPVPFPGISNLMVMEHPIFLSICLLLPIYLKLRKQPHQKLLIDKLVLIYCIVITVLNFRIDTSITFWFKLGLNTFLTIWLPYYVISNAGGNFRSYLIALSFGGIILAIGSVAEWFLSWKMYGPLASHIGGVRVDKLSTAYHFRGFGLRISASWFDPIAFGSFMALILFVVTQLTKIGVKTSIYSLGFVGLLFAALLFTDSRGAFLVALVGIAVVLYYKIESQGARNFYKYTIFFVAAIMLINMKALLQFDSSGGSWLYRYNLVQNSGHAFNENPLFGTPFFRDDPVLRATMLQGQGIVDIVNSYLAILLRYGLLGFVLYVWIWFYAMIRVADRIAILEKKDDPLWKVGVVLLGMLVGMAVFIVTTSSIVYLGKLLWLLLALASAYIKNTTPPKKTRRRMANAPV